MVNPPTLYTFNDLRNVGYGQPSARHGLKLLLWLAKDYIKVDYPSGTMKAKFSRDSYGFRHYGNYQSMLPDLDSNEDYFEVGNRNNEKLPGHLRTKYNKHHPASNKDRVIVRMKKRTGVINEVYITEHYHWSDDFNPNRTYHISGDLIRILQNQNADQFTFQNQHGNRGAGMGNRPTYACFNQSRLQSMRIENVPNSDCENVMVRLAITVITVIILAIVAIFSKDLKQ